MSSYIFQRFSLFGRICKQYMHACMHNPEISIEQLFGFLDGRVENMDVKMRNEKIVEINKDLEAKAGPTNPKGVALESM